MRVLDAGGLIALDRDDRDAWALLTEVHRAGLRPVVPAPVVAQAWRGGARQARLATALAGMDLLPADGVLVKRAGALLGLSATTDVEDALVARVAEDRPGWEIVTSDPADIANLMDALGIHRVIRVV